MPLPPLAENCEIRVPLVGHDQVTGPLDAGTLGVGFGIGFDVAVLRSAFFELRFGAFRGAVVTG